MGREGPQAVAGHLHRLLTRPTSPYTAEETRSGLLYILEKEGWSTDLIPVIARNKVMQDRHRVNLVPLIRELLSKVLSLADGGPPKFDHLPVRFSRPDQCNCSRPIRLHQEGYEIISTIMGLADRARQIRSPFHDDLLHR